MAIDTSGWTAADWAAYEAEVAESQGISFERDPFYSSAEMAAAQAAADIATSPREAVEVARKIRTSLPVESRRVRAYTETAPAAAAAAMTATPVVAQAATIEPDVGVYEAKNIFEILGLGVGGVEDVAGTLNIPFGGTIVPEWGLPGGKPGYVPDAPDGSDIIKIWDTKTAIFCETAAGNRYVLKKISRRGLPDKLWWKKVKKGKPVVIGKALTKKNLNKALRVLKRFRGRKRTYHLVIPGGH